MQVDLVHGDEAVTKSGCIGGAWLMSWISSVAFYFREINS